LDVIVYVETNFLMSVAMGREARGDELLAAVSVSLRVAIPSGCYMESFSAFDDERRRRN
jgi:rRNA-processing protein FCF1